MPAEVFRLSETISLGFAASGPQLGCCYFEEGSSRWLMISAFCDSCLDLGTRAWLLPRVVLRARLKEEASFEASSS